MPRCVSSYPGNWKVGCQAVHRHAILHVLDDLEGSVDKGGFSDCIHIKIVPFIPNGSGSPPFILTILLLQIRNLATYWRLIILYRLLVSTVVNLDLLCTPASKKICKLTKTEVAH